MEISEAWETGKAYLNIKNNFQIRAPLEIYHDQIKSASFWQTCRLLCDGGNLDTWEVSRGTHNTQINQAYSISLNQFTDKKALSQFDSL